MAENNEWKICELCDKRRNINWKCIECGDILCDVCKQRHMKGKLTSKHKVINKNEKNQESNIRAEIECETHVTEQINMFCVRCMVPVCRLCMETKHKRHEVTRIQQGAGLIRNRLLESIGELENTYFPQIKSLLTKFYALKFQYESDNLKVNRNVESRLKLFQAASIRKAEQMKKDNFGRDGDNGMLYVNKIKALQTELSYKEGRIQHCKENILKMNDFALSKNGLEILNELNIGDMLETVTLESPGVPTSNFTTDDIDEELFAAIKQRTGSNYEKSFVSRETQTNDLTILVTDEMGDDAKWSNIKQQYNEIFQVEWKIAFDAVSNKRSKMKENEIIQLLLGLFKTCYQHCKDQAAIQWDGILKQITMTDPTEENQILVQFGGNGFGRYLEDLKEARKAAALYNARNVEKSLRSTPNFTDNFGEDIVEGCALFISKCIDVCWLIAVHEEPPYVLLDVENEASLNEAIYRPYNDHGSYIDYLVWPALLVYPDGPVLCKGVVGVCDEQ